MLKSASYITEGERSNLLSLEQIIRASNMEDLQMQGQQHLEILRNMRQNQSDIERGISNSVASAQQERASQNEIENQRSRNQQAGNN